MKVYVKSKDRVSRTLDANRPIQRATTIDYQPEVITYLKPNYRRNEAAEELTQTVGVEMHAQLDPNDPRMGSSTPQSYGLYATSGYRGKFVQGHLLNADLGGQGVYENLFPFSSGLNHKHSTCIEDGVKMALINCRDQNKMLFYNVVVNHNPDGGIHTPDTLARTSLSCSYGCIGDSTSMSLEISGDIDMKSELADMGFGCYGMAKNPEDGNYYLNREDDHCYPNSALNTLQMLKMIESGQIAIVDRISGEDVTEKYVLEHSDS